MLASPAESSRADPCWRSVCKGVQSSYTLATLCKEPTHWKRPWCWERLKAGGEGDDRGWDGWIALLTQWTWVWGNSRRQWRTGKPGCSPRAGGHFMDTLTSCSTAFAQSFTGDFSEKRAWMPLKCSEKSQRSQQFRTCQVITFVLLVIKSLLKGELSPTSPCPPSSTPCATQIYVSMIYGDSSSWALMDLISWRETWVEGGLCNKIEPPSLQLTQRHNWHPLSPSSLLHSKFPPPSATTQIDLDLGSFSKEPGSIWNTSSSSQASCMSPFMWAKSTRRCSHWVT